MHHDVRTFGARLADTRALEHPLGIGALNLILAAKISAPRIGRALLQVGALGAHDWIGGADSRNASPSGGIDVGGSGRNGSGRRGGGAPTKGEEIGPAEQQD